MIIRIPDEQATLDVIVENLQNLTSEVKYWFTDKVGGDGWTVQTLVYNNQWGDVVGYYHKVWVKEPRLATLLLLYV